MSLPFPLFLCVPRDTGDLHLIGFHLIFSLTSLTVSAYSSELFIFHLLSFSSVPIAHRHVARSQPSRIYLLLTLHRRIFLQSNLYGAFSAPLIQLECLIKSHLSSEHACTFNFTWARICIALECCLYSFVVPWVHTCHSTPLEHQLSTQNVLGNPCDIFHLSISLCELLYSSIGIVHVPVPYRFPIPSIISIFGSNWSYRTRRYLPWIVSELPIWSLKVCTALSPRRSLSVPIVNSHSLSNHFPH